MLNDVYCDAYVGFRYVWCQLNESARHVRVRKDDICTVVRRVRLSQRKRLSQLKTMTTIMGDCRRDFFITLVRALFSPSLALFVLTLSSAG